MQEKSPGSDQFVAPDARQGIEIGKKLRIWQDFESAFTHAYRAACTS
jgi:hypothetical protein